MYILEPVWYTSREVAQGYDFIELEVDQLINLVARDDITAESELDIFRRALSWLEYDKESRMRHAGGWTNYWS